MSKSGQYKANDRDILAAVCLQGMGMWIPPGVSQWKDDEHGCVLLDVEEEECIRTASVRPGRTGPTSKLTP
jgi:hypothetical protein